MLLLAACDNMANQPRHDPLEESQFYSDRRSARPVPAGAVSRGSNAPGFAGVGQASGLQGEMNSPRSANGELLDSYPFPVTLEVLKRGQERYNIYCSPCHGYTGDGQGIVVQRGFTPPPSFHIDRLRQAPAGYYYEVIRDGFGQMYAYAYRVPSSDRWAIAAYIRALQLSQNATQEDIPANELQELLDSAP